MTGVKIPDMGGATINTIDVNGVLIPMFHKPVHETEHIFNSIPNFKFRADDIMLCTYPKAGTNWVFEIIKMILNKSTEPLQSSKILTMLEYQTAEDVDKEPSPRVVDCHHRYRYLPISDMKTKQIKTVLCCRNPKDTAVSYYHHMKGMKSYGYDGKWGDWLPVYLQGKLEYGKYTGYLLEWEDTIKAGAGFPLHVMYYEDLKLNGLGELEKLLQFLDIQIEDGLKKDIMEMCGFQRMKINKMLPDELIDVFFKKSFQFFRKGQVGDWKNWFTVAQNEMLEELWEAEMKDSTMFPFKFIDPTL